MHGHKSNSTDLLYFSHKPKYLWLLYLTMYVISTELIEKLYPILHSLRPPSFYFYDCTDSRRVDLLGILVKILHISKY